MTAEQDQQFRCAQTREQIQEQIKRGVTSDSDRENLKSLQRNEQISCIPPLVALPPSAAAKPAVYPREALRQRSQGVVIVRVELAADGSVKSDSVYTSSGSLILDHAAVSAVRHWRFDTGSGLTVRVPVKFSLGT